jgi:hypothetical protein
MLSTSKTVRGPARAGTCRLTPGERERILLDLHEGERAQERSRIDRLMRLVERQARMLEACRRHLGDSVFEKIRAEVELV